MDVLVQSEIKLTWIQWTDKGPEVGLGVLEMQYRTLDAIGGVATNAGKGPGTCISRLRLPMSIPNLSASRGWSTVRMAPVSTKNSTDAMTPRFGISTTAVINGDARASCARNSPLI